MSADTELLTTLSRAFRAPAGLPYEPSPLELTRLHMALDAHNQSETRRRPLRVVLRVQRRFAAVGAVAMLATAGTAVAATGALPTMPRVVRSVAHDVGLPVTAPEVDDVHSALGRLKQAQRIGDPVKIEKEARGVRTALTRVDGGDRQQLTARATPVLSTADASLEEHRHGHRPPDNAADATTQVAQGAPGQAGGTGVDGADDSSSGPAIAITPPRQAWASTDDAASQGGDRPRSGSSQPSGQPRQGTDANTSSGSGPGPNGQDGTVYQNYPQASDGSAYPPGDSSTYSGDPGQDGADGTFIAP